MTFTESRRLPFQAMPEFRLRRFHDAPCSTTSRLSRSPRRCAPRRRAILQVSISSAPSATPHLRPKPPSASDTRPSHASPTARSVTMPARKRAASEMEAKEPIETPSTLQKLRNMWQFANLAQYISLFGDAVKIDKDFDIEVCLPCARHFWECAERSFDGIRTD